MIMTVSFNLRNCIPAMLAIGFTLAVTAISPAQELSVERAKAIPPTDTPKEQLEFYLRSIDWKQLQLQAMHDRLAASRDQIKHDLQSIGQKIEELEESLPVELQFSTPDTRAQLATHLVQLLLTIKLELAVVEEKIAAQGQATDPVDEQPGRLRPLELEMERAEVELEAAKDQWRLFEAQMSQGVVPDYQRPEMETRVSLARLQVLQAEAALELASEQPKAQQQLELSRLLLEQKPLRSKLESAERMLAKMKEAGSTLRRIEQLKRERDLIHRDLEWVAAELGPISRERLELESLETLLKAEAPKQEESPAK